MDSGIPEFEGKSKKEGVRLKNKITFPSRKRDPSKGRSASYSHLQHAHFSPTERTMQRY